MGFEAGGHEIARNVLPVTKPLLARRRHPWWYLRATRPWVVQLTAEAAVTDVIVASYLPAAAAAFQVLRDARVGIPLVYDAHNDEHRLAGQFRSPRHARYIGELEHFVVQSADVVWVAGAKDTATLRKRFPEASFVDVPNGVGDLPDLTGSLRRPESAFTFGSWDYEPNRAGLRRLAGGRVDRSGTFYVFGESSRRFAADVSAQARDAQPGIQWRFEGFEPDHRRMSEAVGGPAVVALWLGGGTKLRSVQIAAMGVPLFATEEAVSGLPAWFVERVSTHSSPEDLMRSALGAGSQAWSRAAELREATRAELSWWVIVRRALEATPPSVLRSARATSRRRL